MSFERFIEVRRQLREHAADVWETIDATEFEKFEDFHARVRFLGNAMLEVEHDLRTTELVETALEASDAAIDTRDISSAMASLSALALHAAAQEGSLRLLGQHLKADLERRFQDGAFYPALDEATNEEQDRQVTQAAVQMLTRGTSAPADIAVATFLLRKEHTQLACERVVQLAKESPRTRLLSDVISDVLFVASLNGSELPLPLLYQLHELVFDFDTFGSEEHLWDALLIRTPAERGWRAYADLVSAYERRCRDLTNVLATHEYAFSLAPAVLQMCESVTTAWLAAWRFEDARRSVVEVFRPLAEQFASPGDLETCLVLESALRARREAPPQDLVEHLVGEDQSLAAAALILRNAATVWPDVTVDLVEPVRLVLFGGPPFLLARAFWPISNRLNFLLSTGQIAASNTVHDGANTISRIIGGRNVVGAFRPETGWHEHVSDQR